MEQDLLKIRKLLLKYIKIIVSEFKGCNKESLLNNGELVEFNKDNSITFIVKNGKLLLPREAYNIFPSFKNYANYGSNIGNYRDASEYLETDTTYYDYINHLIEGAISVYDFFSESLLHEAMHICGSSGGTPLEEGINELKTRELAQKYNIRIAAYGYSKEVEIAKRLQEIIGKDILDELTFIPKNKKYDFLVRKKGIECAKLYELLSKKMIELSIAYYKENFFIDNPCKKAELYESIIYSEVYSILDEYKKNKMHVH